jgi:hypothetical protein
LRVEVDGRIGRLTLTQPDKLNPLGTTALQEIADAASWFDTTGASIVIVTGEGRAFSSGFDLREFAGGGPGSADYGRKMADALEGMTALTIAAIKGPCVGGGVVLAGACDLRIAADDTVFSIPEVNLGIPLAWGGITRLTREIGPASPANWSSPAARSTPRRRARSASSTVSCRARSSNRLSMSSPNSSLGRPPRSSPQRSGRFTRRSRMSLRRQVRGPTRSCSVRRSATPKRAPPPRRTSRLAVTDTAPADTSAEEIDGHVVPEARGEGE